MNVVEQIENHIRPVLAEKRFELIETQYRKEAGQWILRIFIDKMDDTRNPTQVKLGSNVTLGDCEKVSEVVGASLDDSNLVEPSYVLEVSSPGVNRPLKTEDHFRRFVGQNVKVSTFAPLDETTRQKNFSGILLSCDGMQIEVVDAVSGKVQIQLSTIAKAHLDLI